MNNELPMIEGFRVMSLIGRGAYGEVFLAEDTAGRRVAVKVVTPRIDLTDKMIQRELAGLQRYLSVTQRHPHLVRVQSVVEGLPDGGFACVMELADSVRGHGIADYEPWTLRHLPRTSGRLSVAESLRIAIAICEALEHLHRNGLFHRDVKPANIIFVHGQPKLADVGLVTPLRRWARRATTRRRPPRVLVPTSSVWARCCMRWPQVVTARTSPSCRRDSRTSPMAPGCWN